MAEWLMRNRLYKQRTAGGPLSRFFEKHIISVRRYRLSLSRFMEKSENGSGAQKIQRFDTTLGNQFLLDTEGNWDYSQLSKRKKIWLEEWLFYRSRMTQGP